jgi:hypothetical protein
VKRIIIDGSEIEVLDYKWINEPLKHFVKWKLTELPISIDYIKIKIGRNQNCKELLKKVLFSNEYVIEADNKKAKFYLNVGEMKRLFNWYKIGSDEIEIEFVGTGNEVD